MTDDTEKRKIPEHRTSTVELFEKFEAATNVVTKGAYRSMIAERLGIVEHQDTVDRIRLMEMRMGMERLTYSFESRRKMRDLFSKWMKEDAKT